MKLTYETSIATFVQFVILSFLNFANAGDSIITTCRAKDGECVSNALVTFIYIMLIVGWFAVLWVLGYAAQNRRSKRLAQLLIGAEAFVAFIAAYNAKHHTNTLSLVTSLADLALALWVIALAFRLMLAKGGRVVSRARVRKRKYPTTDL